MVSGGSSAADDLDLVLMSLESNTLCQSGHIQIITPLEYLVCYLCVCACSSAGYFPNLCVTDRYGLFKDFFACTHFLVCASLLFLPAMTTKFKKINKSRVKYVKSCANSSQNRTFYVAQSRFLMFKGSCYVILANTGSLHAKILPSRSFLIYQN